MKEYTNDYFGAKTQDPDTSLWSVDLYNGSDVSHTIGNLEREDDANALITTWVVQEGWTNMDKTEETDPVEWEDPLFERDFLK